MTQQINPYRSRPMSLHFEANGLRLHYLDWGEGPTSHLVLLHGLGSQAHRWDPFGQAVYTDYRVVAPDLRGHGESSHAPDGYFLDLFAADVYHLARHLNLHSFDLVGHSLGAMIAIQFAATYPRLVRRLVLEDGGPGLNAEASRQGSFEAYLRPLAFDTPKEAKAWLRGLNPGDSEEQIGRRFQHTMKQNWAGKWTPRHDHELYWIMDGTAPKVLEGNQELWTKVSQVQCPALLLHGQESVILSTETADRIAAALPRGRLVHIPGAGHSVHSEAFETFRETVLQFLQE